MEIKPRFCPRRINALKAAGWISEDGFSWKFGIFFYLGRSIFVVIFGTLPP